MTSGIILGRAEDNQAALAEEAAEKKEDEGYRRGPNGWQR
jgi:hypothetical protein